jgi:beta-N-acetylhexosaminidase
VDLEEAYNAVLAAVNSGEITEKQLEESVTRIIRTKIKRGIIEIEN